MILFASLAIATTLFQVPDLGADARLDKHVTFKTVAAPAEAAIAGLSQASGLELKVGGAMKHEILLLRLQDVPLRDAMVRLARACAGSWGRDGDVYFLTRTQVDQAKFAAQQHATFLAAMKTEMAKLAKETAKDGPFTPEFAKKLAADLKKINEPQATEGGGTARPKFEEGARLSAQIPAGRLVDRILSKLDPEAIASAPALKRIVYSTSPTKMELPLNVELNGAVSQFVTEANVWSDALSSYTEEEQIQFLPFSRSLQGKVNETPAKVNVIINRDFNGIIGATVEVKVYDSAGKVVGSSQRQLRIEDDAKIMAAMTPDPNEKKLALSQDELAVIAVLTRAMGGPRGKQIEPSPAVRARLMHPDKYEPLATSASTLTLEAAEAKNLNVVADLPDIFLMLGIISTRTGTPTATSFLAMLDAIPPGMCPSKNEKGWLEVDGGVADGENAFIQRDNREELARLYNSGDGTTLGTEPLARFAYLGGGGSTDFLWLTLTTVLCPSSEFEDANKWRMLALLGSILHHRDDVPLASGKLALSALDPDSLEMLTDIVFRHDPRTMTYQGQSFTAEIEPCELLPNGLPTNGYLEITSSIEDVVYTIGDHPQAIPAFNLALDTAQRNHPGKFGNFEPTVSMTDKFRPGTKRTYRMMIHLSDQLSCASNFDENHPPSGDPVGFDQLPEKYKAEVKRALENFEKSN